MNSPTIEELHDAIRRVRRRRNVIVHVRQIGWSLAILAALFILGGSLEMALHPPSLFRMLFFCLLAAAGGSPAGVGHPAPWWKTKKTSLPRPGNC